MSTTTTETQVQTDPLGNTDEKTTGRQFIEDALETKTGFYNNSRSRKAFGWLFFITMIVTLIGLGLFLGTVGAAVFKYNGNYFDPDKKSGTTYKAFVEAGIGFCSAASAFLIVLCVLYFIYLREGFLFSQALSNSLAKASQGPDRLRNMTGLMSSLVYRKPGEKKERIDYANSLRKQFLDGYIKDLGLNYKNYEDFVNQTTNEFRTNPQYQQLIKGGFDLDVPRSRSYFSRVFQNKKSGSSFDIPKAIEQLKDVTKKIKEKTAENMPTINLKERRDQLYSYISSVLGTQDADEILASAYPEGSDISERRRPVTRELQPILGPESGSESGSESENESDGSESSDGYATPTGQDPDVDPLGGIPITNPTVAVNPLTPAERGRIGFGRGTPLTPAGRGFGRGTPRTPARIGRGPGDGNPLTPRGVLPTDPGEFADAPGDK